MAGVRRGAVPAVAPLRRPSLREGCPAVLGGGPRRTWAVEVLLVAQSGPLGIDRCRGASCKMSARSWPIGAIVFDTLPLLVTCANPPLAEGLGCVGGGACAQPRSTGWVGARAARIND